MPETDEQVELADLAAAWRTVAQLARCYHLGSPGEATLIEARRLIEVEIRTLYSDDAREVLRESG